MTTTPPRVIAAVVSCALLACGGVPASGPGAPADVHASDDADTASSPALDITSAAGMEAFADLVGELRQLGLRHRLGLDHADAGCPLRDDGRYGQTTYRGGCETSDGARFDGVLDQASAEDGVRWDAAGWTVVAPDGERLAADGELTLHVGADRDESALTGAFGVFEVAARVTGTLRFERSGNAHDAVFDLDVDGVVVSGRMYYVQIEGDCGHDAPRLAGHVELRSEGRVATAHDVGGCEPCWPILVDGAPSGESLCRGR